MEVHCVQPVSLSPPAAAAATNPIDNTSISSHKLTGKWDMYYHLPHNMNWDLSSYKIISSNIDTIEKVILLNDAIPENAIKTCMFFVMRAGITPLWEDPKNRNGGCFSFKILNKSVYDVWKNVFFHLAGGTLFKTRELEKCVNGITISPKKNFCILKIWMLTTEHQNPKLIVDIPGLFKGGCIFKGHTPEY
jgi:Eukaryotic initiation factor 4E